MLASRFIAARAVCFANSPRALCPKRSPPIYRPTAPTRPKVFARSSCARRGAAPRDGSANGLRSFFARRRSRSLAGRPVDIKSVGAQMRLYPQNNVAEKRLLFTPQYFDPRERALLAERLFGDFVFLDIGASVGGYALFVAAHGGRSAREFWRSSRCRKYSNASSTISTRTPSPMSKRSPARWPIATARSRCSSMRTTAARPRCGSSARMRGGRNCAFPARACCRCCCEEGYERVDAIKLDIEGAEDLVLDPFFRDAPPVALAAV